MSQGLGSGASQKTGRFFQIQISCLYEFMPFGDRSHLATSAL